jgi:tetratricopeptide (TPR) repeat protein
MKYEAIQVLKKIREIDPKNEFFKLKVTKFYQNRNLDEERSLIQGPKDKWDLCATEQNSSSPQAQEIHLETFDLEGALREDDSVRFYISSEETDAHKDRFWADEKYNQLPFSEIFEELKDGINSAPDQNSPTFHYNLGVAYQELNQLKEAAEEFKLAVDGIDDKQGCYLRLAVCTRLLQLFNEAEQYIKKALALPSLTEEDKLDLLYELGLTHKANGDKNMALKTFRKVFEADKNYKSVSKEIEQLSG